MKNPFEIWHNFPMKLNLPGESMPGEFLAELHNGNRLLIEGVNGIINYSNDCVSVEIKIGQLCVYGNGLKMVKMTGRQLVILGSINSVTISRRC